MDQYWLMAVALAVVEAAEIEFVVAADVVGPNFVSLSPWKLCFQSVSRIVHSTCQKWLTEAHATV